MPENNAGESRTRGSNSFVLPFLTPLLRGGPSSSAAGFKGSELRFEEEGHWGTVPPFRNQYATHSAMVTGWAICEMSFVRSSNGIGR